MGRRRTPTILEMALATPYVYANASDLQFSVEADFTKRNSNVGFFIEGYFWCYAIFCPLAPPVFVNIAESSKYSKSKHMQSVTSVILTVIY